jgi:hypothetical protein
MQRLALLKACFLVFLVATAACRMRQVSVPVPPAPPAAPASAPVPAAAPEPVTAETAPPPSAPAPKKPARSAASSSPAPASTTPAPAAPKLGDVLSSDEQKQLSASIDQSLSRAQASLNRTNGHQLTKDQQSEVAQIQSFMKQAQSTRNSDPSGAKSLAERAEVLARDLAGSIH